jgi:cytochrome c oxidase subunit IV
MTDEHAHPDEIKYVKVAAILAILTAAEVGVIYVSAWHSFSRPLLGAMMLVKFTMVAAYFMHLKFDSKIFRRLFIVGIILALAVYGVALWTFTFAHRLPGAS